ncbi:MAG: P-loop NTPase fold protein [Victivallales bacterium]
MSDPVQSGLNLKLVEPPVNTDNPWTDDALQREQYSTALTNLLDGQVSPLTVSLNGTWGSGKTFFLKRWQAQLNKNGFKSIYFNAWEDDHCGDPLVAIIGQIWESLKGSDLKEIGKNIKESAKPLLTKTIFNSVRTITNGIVDLDENELKSVAEKTVDDYFTTREQRDELKKRLSEMASKVSSDTKHPMIFIIDELDRCRPTFAIELLERVKHIFDAPNLVFVFGIDRRQLGGAIQSVYGNIDVDGYLRRFFDMEFMLPLCDAKLFCQHMLQAHNLPDYFQNKSKKVEHKVHQEEFMQFQNYFSLLAYYLKLSLRDIQHSVRSFVFIAKNLPDRNYMYPGLLAVLVILRIKNNEIYLEFVKGQIPPAKVMDFIEEFFPAANSFNNVNRSLDYIEIILYLTAYDEYERGNIILDQLNLLSTGGKLTNPECITKRTKRKNIDDIKDFISIYNHWISNRYMDNNIICKEVLHKTVKWIEMASMMIKER